MLGGEYRHSIDPKNRIFIPAKLRDELGTTFVIARDIRDKCLKMYSLEEWKNYMEPILEQARRLQSKVLRVLNGSMTEVTPDSHGRVVLPKDLSGYAAIEKNVVVVGCYNYAEIWAEEIYDQMKAEENLDELLEELEALGL
ncbi:MAG: division/cell wall cluster transcriptional repressor MraZ [Clostridia bacterium]|nr:division/cell wall cluster transcriptional repressor MraZ [Clostridia bacterium]